jgi:hypothetical protein
MGQGGILEWFNPPDSYFGQGIHELDTDEMIRKETESIMSWWYSKIQTVPEVNA